MRGRIKQFQLLGLFWVISISLFAQENLMSDDFETYTAGQKLTEQVADSVWMTWSANPDTEEDAMVTSELAYSGSNSLQVIYLNNLVYQLGDNISGRYQLTFYLNVKSENIAYFSLLQEFTSSNINKGLEVFFNVDSTANIMANGKITIVEYPVNTWLKINVIIDLDDDFATLFIDGKEITNFFWSKGSDGRQDIQKLKALNFYGKKGDYPVVSHYYVDDIEFKQIETPASPENLVAELSDNNVSLSWDAPADSNAESYLIFRDGEIVATGIAETTYDDSNLYPTTHTFEVKASYGESGYSLPSNVVTQFIEGGIERKNTLFEIATATWCGYCPGAALGADDLYAEGDNAAVIEYHRSDNFSNYSSNNRIDYYGIMAYPTTKVDGLLGYATGSKESIYPWYKEMHDSRKDHPSLHDITLNVSRTDSQNYKVEVTIDEVFDYFEEMRLFFAVTESHIQEEWQNLSELNFVCRKMYPTLNGIELNFSTTNTLTKTFDVKIKEEWVTDNCEFVIFVQDIETGEVSQTVKYKPGNYTSIEDQSDIGKVEVFPNPVNDVLNIEIPDINKVYSVSVYNLVGVLVENVICKSGRVKISMNDKEEGIYVVKVNYNNGNSEAYKIIKR